MKTVSYCDYLTEKKLGSLLQEIFIDCTVIFQYKIKVNTRKFIVDFFIPELNMAIEFNGDSHYRKGSVLYRDKLLEEYCKKESIRLIDIPYWLQMDDRVFSLLFGLSIANRYIKDRVKFNTNFPNGFISKSCVLPVDFNIDGWKRFWKEYESLGRHPDFKYPSILREIYDSIYQKIHLKGVENVMGIYLGNAKEEGTKAFFLAKYPS